MKKALKPSMKILVIHNNDFPSDSNSGTITDSDEPPSQIADSSMTGILARASIVGVAKNVGEALNSLGYKNIDIVPIDRIPQIHSLIRTQKYDFIFNLCESLDGDSQKEVEIAEILEDAKVPYSGNGPTALRSCLSKFACTEALRKNGVTIPGSFHLSSVEDVDSFEFPTHRLIVKPNDQDGSTGIEFSSVVSSKEELREKVNELLLAYGGSVVAQEYIEGREINVAILGDKPSKWWNCTEIDFSALDPDVPKILNYSSKWMPESSEYKKTVSMLAELTPTVRKRLFTVAAKSIEALGINSYARVDCRVDSNEIPYVIDVNPNCDLDPDAGFTKAIGYNGNPYKQLIKKIMETAVKNFNEKNREGFSIQLAKAHLPEIFPNQRVIYEN